MTRVSKDNDGKTGQDWDNSLRVQDANVALLAHIIALQKVVDNKNDKITDRDQSDDTSVFERVESAEKGERDYDEPG